MYGPWTVHRWYGDMHVVPMADSRPHTWPMCWCNPRPENVATRDGWVRSVTYSHNALDDRFV